MLPAIVIASLVVAGLTTTSRAATVGLGNQDCGTWTTNNPAKGGVGLFYQQWIFGFLSGASHADPDHAPVGTTLKAGGDTVFVLPKASVTVLRGKFSNP